MERKFKVISVDDIDRSIGIKVGDIVTLIQTKEELSLCKLPERLHGKGHDNFRKFKEQNYWWFFSSQLEEIKWELRSNLNN